LDDETITLPAALVQPDYRGGGTVNLSESILRHFGAAEAGMVGLRAELLPPALLDGASVVMMLIVDGLGYLQLVEQIAAGNAPNLVRLLRERPATFQPITTTTPSMTSCALTTLHTAATPAQHGLVGWNLYLQEEGRVVDMLKFAPAADPYSGEIESINPDTFLPLPTIYQRLASAGVKPIMVNYGQLRETALTRIMHAGADYQNLVTSSDLCINMRQLAEQAAGPTFICGYWDKVDTIAHVYGSRGEAIAAEIAQFDFILGRELLSKLRRKDVALIITADHGQITTPPQRIILSNADREMMRLLAQPPAGDNRTVYLHAKAGQAAALLDYMRHRYGAITTALTREQFIAANLLGGPVAQRYLSRIGDVVLLMHDTWRIRTLYYTEQAKLPPLIGMHGGMMPEEMYSTLIAARLG
jgi:Type I phosphodiesterase / nucleotide pyrophosphatase